jgi:transposase
VPESSRPSYEELAALVVSQAAVIESLTARVAEQEARIAELERQLGRNSKNSSMPPSSDRFAGEGKQPRRGGRRPGKQPGAPGAGLQMSGDPDEIIDHVPAACGGCGAGLGGAGDGVSGLAAAGFVARQVHDLPERVAPQVIEHRLHRVRCGCGHVSTAPAPGQVTASVQYGPRLTALIAYLVVVQHLPYERAVTLVADLCPGLNPSTGWAVTAVARAADALGGANDQIRDLLRRQPVLHADETGTSIAGNRWWLHVACTPTLTAFHLDRSRGRVAVNTFGILASSDPTSSDPTSEQAEAFSGTLVHDALSVYDAYTAAAHALCGAHILRELTAAAQAHSQQAWPRAAIDALTDLLTAAHTARGQGRTAIPPDVLDPLLRRWNHAVRVGLACHPKTPGRKQSKTRNLLQRLRNRAGQVLAFTHDLTVPFSNNQAERDLRPAKTQLKISGCHRSATGARNWLAIRAYTSTARKNGIHIPTALHDAITGNAWSPSYTD